MQCSADGIQCSVANDTLCCPGLYCYEETVCLTDSFVTNPVYEEPPVVGLLQSIILVVIISLLLLALRVRSVRIADPLWELECGRYDEKNGPPAAGPSSHNFTLTGK